MSKTNSTPLPPPSATQSLPAPNDSPSSAAPKPAFNYAAAAARSSASNRPNPSPASSLSSFASAVVANPSPLTSVTSAAKPSNRPSESVSSSRPINGSTSSGSAKPTVPSQERKSSVVSVKAHNIKPASSHISFGSLADIPPKSDNASSVLSSSPANPPTLSRRDGPPVFGSVSTDPAKQNISSSTSSVALSSSKISSTPSTSTSTKAEKKKIDFQSFFMSGGESLSHPPAPPSTGSSPSPSISYRGDPTQNRRNPTNFDPSNPIPSTAPLSPRPAHITGSNGPSNGPSYHSPLSGASRAFTPGQGPPPISQPQPPPQHQYGPSAAHWQSGPAPNSPHFVPVNPPHNPNMTNYPVPNGPIVPNHGNQQFLHKPPPFQHRNGPGGNSNPMYPSTGRSNLHHQQRNTMTGPPSPRLPPGNAPNGTQSPSYQHSSNPQAMPPPFWPQGPYPPTGPGPYPPYGYNPNTMPTYPHPNNFPPQHAQHHSPQLTNQSGPPVPPQPVQPTSVPSLPNPPRPHPPVAPLPIPSSPVPVNSSYPPPYPPSLYSPSASHSRGPSLSYNAPSFNPSVVSPDFKPHTPNVSAPAFQPRRSAAVAIKKPPVTPISEVTNKSEETSSANHTSKDRRASTSSKGHAIKPSTDSSQSKAKADEPIKKPSVDEDKQTVEAEKLREIAEAKAVAEAEEKRLLEERKLAEEAEAARKVEQAERQKREAQEKAQKEEKDAKEKADQLAKEKVEQEVKEAREKLEREAKEKVERDLKEKEKRELQLKQQQELKESVEKQAKGRSIKETKAQIEQKVMEQNNSPKESIPVSAESSISLQTTKPVESANLTKSSDNSASTLPEPASLPGLPPKPANGVYLPSSTTKTRPTPIDVNALPHKRNTSTSNEVITPALPSALSSARKIEDLGLISYPDNIQSPRSELNADATPGKFRYDRAFLLQFMEVCKNKPVQLPDLDSIGMVESHHTPVNPISRTQSSSGQRRSATQLPPSRGPSGSLTPAGSLSMMGPPSLPNRTGPGAGMGMFASGVARTNEERFNQANRPTLGAMPIGSGLMLPGRPTGQMSRSPSSNTLPSMISNGARDPSRRSGRGSRRDGTTNTPVVAGVNSNLNRGMPLQPMFPVEVVAPLQPSANSWAAARSNPLEEDSPEMVNRKVKALLNKLTLDKFESISDQVIAWANKSEKERDGRILRQVIALIFEKATDEAHWSEMYAKLCRKLMEKLSSEVKDENVLDNSGNKVHGGHLFRKYLLNRCQEDYERGWTKRDELAAAAADKAADDAVKQAANEKSRAEAEASGKEAPSKEAEILSDEYYAAQKAKRQGLGLVRFIGELFKLNMLTERIMHECIKKLLSNIETPEEEDIESLCRLMMTVGRMLDHEKAVSHINVYFTRMAAIANNTNLSSRARFMVQDVIDTRLNKWVGRNVSSGPKLISQIHQEAAQAAAEQARQSQTNKTLNKMQDLSRGGSRGGRNRDQGPAGDGWLPVGNTAPPPRPSKAGDLTQFGKLRDTSSSGRPSFGPSNVFANKGKLRDGKSAIEREPAVAVASNPFAALGGDGIEGMNSGLSRKPSTQDLAPSGRPRLNLAPRTLPLPGQNSSTDADASEKSKTVSDPIETKSQPEMSDAAAARLIDSQIKEFLHLKLVDEAVAAVSLLPPSRHSDLIKHYIEKSYDLKPEVVNLVATLFQKFSNDTISKDTFLKVFESTMEMVPDFAVDCPWAYTTCATLMKASNLSEAEVKVLAQKVVTEKPDEGSRKLLDAFTSAKIN
ncbi:hypothetical protein O181_000266 [Austropuccinia psidii MF-1]|uniref:MI domain-containing protein n=1 Tax=Austropuccinia psidii MF-1 TaxID=1389203 RepID=A0A9Q3B8N7_9BASI|nr:hypothetical protein [Austropuccinia psidii MF-1]